MTDQNIQLTQPTWRNALSIPNFSVADDQWATEVEMWLRKGIANAILHTQNGALFNHIDPEVGFNGNFYEKHSLCNRILFRDADYTNINWIGLWITTASLIFFCLASYFIELIDKNTRKAWNLFVGGVKFLRRKLYLLGTTLKITILNYARSEKLDLEFWEWLLAFQRRAFLPIFTDPRLWFNGRGRNVPVIISELQNIERVSSFVTRENQ